MKFPSTLAILLGTVTAAAADVVATDNKKQQSKETKHYHDDGAAVVDRQLWPVPDIGDFNIDLADDEVRFLIKYDNDEGKALLQSLAKDGKIDVDIQKRGIASIVTSASNRDVLEKDKNIAGVEDDEILTINDGYEKNLRGDRTAHRVLSEETPYGLAMVQADQLSPGPTKIKICVVDTGYDLGHEDLPDSTNHDVTGWEQDTGTYGFWDVDGHSHGTHVAGTIGAIGGNGIGVESVLNDPYAFEFIIAKGLSDGGSASTAHVIDAVEACADAGANIINLSLGGGAYSAIAEQDYKDVYDQGVLIIAAAGNGGNSAYSYPASYPDVMSVGALTSGEAIASYSQHNDQVEIAAPGSGVKSTKPGDSYGNKSGTSMATPHVVGVAALVWSHFPDCTNTQIRNVLLKTAKDLGTSGCDNYYGSGLVQALDAYNLLNVEGCSAGDSLKEGEQSFGGCEQHPDFTFPPTPSPTAFNCDENKVHLVLNTDNYPLETSWKITDDSDGSTVASISSGTYSALGTEYEEYFCLPDGSYTFEIEDSYGDGICCGYGNGDYSINVNCAEVHSGGEFGSSESTTFTATMATSSCVDTPQPTPSPTPQPTASCSLETLQNNEVYYIHRTKIANSDPTKTLMMNGSSSSYSVLGSEESNTSGDSYKFKVKVEDNNVGNGIKLIRLKNIQRSRFLKWNGSIVKGGTDAQVFGQSIPDRESFWFAHPEDDCSGYRLQHSETGKYLHGSEDTILTSNMYDVTVKDKKTATDKSKKQIWDFVLV